MERLRFLLRQYLDRLLSGREPAADYDEAEWDPLFEKIMAKADAVGEEQQPRIGDRRRWWAAAAVLFLAAGSVWVLVSRSGRRAARVEAVAAAAAAHDAAPGRSKAILTLADGKTVTLDSTRSGIIGRQGGSAIVSRNKQLVYEHLDGSSAIGYNILTTPRGGQYSVVLPDGTKAWLNADSYLRYPTDFTGSERVVELKGEGYFEVAARAGQPFRVAVLRDKGEPLRVDVLGTHFNIMDYSDEPAIRATLLEGAVRVSDGGSAVVLRPGEQARLGSEGRLTVSQADVDEAVAWKDGLFQFNGADIGEVMRQLSRWYDLDVVYKNGVPKDLFQGEMYRSVHVSELLKILEASGVHCVVEGKKLLVN